MKIILFFIINFILLIIFWYYISCFCAVYPNTQIHLLKDTLISYGFSLISPFFFNTIPGICRIPSLRVKIKDKVKQRTFKCIYLLSKFIQIV